MCGEVERGDDGVWLLFQEKEGDEEKREGDVGLPEGPRGPTPSLPIYIFFVLLFGFC